MGTFIGRNTGQVHAGDGDVYVDGDKVTDSKGNPIERGAGETIEVRSNGDVYVDGVKQ